MIDGFDAHRIPTVLAIIDPSAPLGVRFISDAIVHVAVIKPGSAVAVIADDSHQIAGGAVRRAALELGVSCDVVESGWQATKRDEGLGAR